MPGTKIINSIIRASDILKTISEGYNRVEDIYPRVGLNKSTTHRILKSLAASGLSYQSPLNNNYFLGPLCMRLATNPSVSHQMLIITAIDELRKLRDRTGESILLGIPNGNQRLVLKEIRSKQKVAMFLGEGDMAPLYTGGSGRTLLSQYTDKDLNMIISKIDIIPTGLKTIKDKKALINEIHKIRKKGYGESFGETHPEAAGVSFPVKGYCIPVVISLMAPKSRYKKIDILNDVKLAAKRISDKLLKDVDYRF